MDSETAPQPPPGLLRRRSRRCSATRDLEVDLDAIRRHVRFLIDGGLTTGQRGPARRRRGRRLLDADASTSASSVAEAVVDEAAGRVPIAMGGQTTSTRELVAARQGRRADRRRLPAGLAAVLLRAHRGRLRRAHPGRAPDAADVGLIVYNTFWTSLGISSAMVERLAEIPNVVSLKWSTPDTGAMAFEQIVSRFSDRFAIIDNQMRYVTSHILGARSIEIHVAQLLAAVGASRLWQMLERGEYAEAQREMVRVAHAVHGAVVRDGGVHQRRRLPRQAVHGAGRAAIRAARGRRPATCGRSSASKARQMLLDCGVPGVVGLSVVRRSARLSAASLSDPMSTAGRTRRAARRPRSSRRGPSAR